MAVFSEKSLKKIVIIKNAKIHSFNNDKSLNIGDATFIDFNVDQYNLDQIKNIKIWFNNLKEKDIDIFLPGFKLN